MNGISLDVSNVPVALAVRMGYNTAQEKHVAFRCNNNWGVSIRQIYPESDLFELAVIYFPFEDSTNDDGHCLFDMIDIPGVTDGFGIMSNWVHASEVVETLYTIAAWENKPCVGDIKHQFDRSLIYETD